MKVFNFLPITISATLVEISPSLEFSGSPRFNQTYDSLENAENCENYCHDLHEECYKACSGADDQEIGEIYSFKLF